MIGIPRSDAASPRGLPCAHDRLMTIPAYDETRTLPLTTDIDIQQRISRLIGVAVRRQLWILFLDHSNIQLPMMIAIDDHPMRPDATVADLAERVEHTLIDAGARSVIVVIERFASSDLTAADTAWATAIHDEFDAQGVPVRGILLSHRRGIRWIAQDDYRY